MGFDFSETGRDYDSLRHAKSHQTLKEREEITVAQASEELIATGKISEVLAVIGGGKEATVLLAREKATHDLVCAKVFRYYTGTIRKRMQGTHHIMANDMAALAARQEYWNLEELHKAGIPVPRPRLILDNILVMDFISNGIQADKPAPLLRDVDLFKWGDPMEYFSEAIEILARMFLDASYVHGDYSEHNLMLANGRLITMDVSQSVQYNQNTNTNTPLRIKISSAVDYLRVDIFNTVQFFRRKYRLEADAEEICAQILAELPEKLRSFLDQAPMGDPYIEYAGEIYEGKARYRNESKRLRASRKREFRRHN